jgi:AraC family L-rhamnose operon regulatory protein RhaS
MEALGRAVLEAVIWEADSSSKHKAVPEPLRLALELVGARFTEPLTLEQLADSAYVTPQHLVRLFRAHLGETPMRYVWRMRTERGVQMLRQTGISVAEAAHRVGFKNVYHFSRAVKERYGKSPIQLRKEEWGLTDDRVG